VIDAKVKRCDLNECEAMCCYDGVYLNSKDQETIKLVVNKFPVFFKHLPYKYIENGTWE